MQSPINNSSAHKLPYTENLEMKINVAQSAQSSSDSMSEIPSTCAIGVKLDFSMINQEKQVNSLTDSKKEYEQNSSSCDKMKTKANKDKAFSFKIAPKSFVQQPSSPVPQNAKIYRQSTSIKKLQKTSNGLSKRRPGFLPPLVIQANTCNNGDEAKSSSTSEQSFKSVLKIGGKTSQKEIDEHFAIFGCKFSQKYYYEPNDIIGEGCAAQVYSCYQKQTEENYVVKITRSDDSAKLTAAACEYQILNKIPAHSNIVKVVEQFTSDQRNLVHTVFERAGTQDLQQYLEENRQYLNDDDLKSLCKQILEAVNHLHKNGIAHRDLKPDNVMVSSPLFRGPVAKLIDFNIAEDIKDKKPKSSLVCGLKRWSAPEEPLLCSIGQVTDEDLIRFDSYSVGCLIQFILTGKAPSENDNLTGQILTKELQKLDCKYNDFVDLVNQLMNINPAKRPTMDVALQHNLFEDLSLKTEYSEIVQSLSKQSTSFGLNTDIECIKIMNALDQTLQAGTQYNRIKATFDLQ